MRFLHYDLNQLSGGEIVTVNLSGVESDVMLMSPGDFRSFQVGAGFSYHGGHARQSPVRLAVPSAGSWHVVVVPGRGGQVSASVSVVG